MAMECVVSNLQALGREVIAFREQNELLVKRLDAMERKADVLHDTRASALAAQVRQLQGQIKSLEMRISMMEGTAQPVNDNDLFRSVMESLQ